MREEAKRVVALLEKKRFRTVREFISIHFEELQESGQPLRELYKFLTSRGISLGTFDSFRVAYGREKRARNKLKQGGAEMKQIRNNLKQSEIETKQNETGLKQPETKTKQSETKVKQPETNSKQNETHGLGLRPITLADGTPIEIDAETGARTFKVRKTRKGDRENT